MSIDLWSFQYENIQHDWNNKYKTLNKKQPKIWQKKNQIKKLEEIKVTCWDRALSWPIKEYQGMNSIKWNPLKCAKLPLQHDAYQQ